MENGYLILKNYFFSYVNRHIDRRVNRKKLFAIEPHIRLLNKSSLIDSHKFMKNKLLFDGVNTPTYENLMLHNVYNFQVNEKGFEKVSYSYRNIYDTFLLLKKINIEKLIVCSEKEFIDYFLTLNELEIFDISKFNLKRKFIRKIYVIFKKRLKFGFNIYYTFLVFTRKLKFFPIQFIDFINNKKYRKHIFEKMTT